MGQQQGHDEARKFIVTSMELEINLQPLYRVYDPFFNVSQSRWWRKVRAVVRGAEKERVHFQGLFVLFSENVLGAGKSLNRQRERSSGQVRREGEGGSNTSVQICSSAVRPQLSSSSALCWSSSLTCVKGKWPRLPLHSPSHWPFTFILVTFTLSPTWRRKEEKDLVRLFRDLGRKKKIHSLHLPVK